MALNSRNTSGITGVHYDNNTRKWISKIKVGKAHHLGSFKDKDEAIAMRKRAEKQFGFHRNHGRMIQSEAA